MDFNEAIKECGHARVNGVCTILPGNKNCNEHVNSGKCPIKQLEKKHLERNGENK